MQAKACFAECALPYGMWNTKKSIALWDAEHKKGITLWNVGHKKRVLPYGSELYKVGEKIVV
mgnify:CR=1 FL=1